MRTTVIPAQVTTVEDMIAGNLNLTQIVLLVASLFISTFIYALVPEKLHFTIFKIALIILVIVSFAVLCIRVKQRIILHWIIILAAYLFRPHLYIFNKNNGFSRTVPVIHHPHKKQITFKAINQVRQKDKVPEFDYQSLARNTNINIRFKRKGLLVVKNYD